MTRRSNAEPVGSRRPRRAENEYPAATPPGARVAVGCYAQRVTLEIETMPNGGTDCCATCWFHSHKLMEMKFGRETSHQTPRDSFCTIRRLPVEDPHYTYCANHPYRRGEPDPIPIGGVDRGNGLHRWRTHPPLRDPDVRQHSGSAA